MGLSSSLGTAGVKQGVCSSTTRPTAPFEGQMIYETDTDMVAVYNGSAWRYIAATTPTNGTVLQVQSTTITGATSTTSTSFVDVSGLSVSITPKSTSSKIMITATLMVSGASTDDTYYNLVRGSTAIGQGTGATNNQTLYIRMTDSLFPEVAHIGFLDSPSTTSSTTYKVQYRTRVGTLYVNNRAYDGGSYVQSGISTITAMEIAG